MQRAVSVSAVCAFRKEVSVGSLSAWSDAYFASEFTHPNGAARLTTHPVAFCAYGQASRVRLAFRCASWFVAGRLCTSLCKTCTDDKGSKQS